MHSSPPPLPHRGLGQRSSVKVVDNEEMALTAAAAGARSILSSAARRATVPLSCAAYSAAGPAGGSIEVEDSHLPRISHLAQFRERRALAVTDITATEWCEKQMAFVLEHGKPERTEAMKAGSDRHAQLEDEVVRKVGVAIRSAEELWSVRITDFLVGTNQLMFEGITREIPVFGVVEGLWMTGIIDEIRLPRNDISFQPILVDTKTRRRPKSPQEAQKRNGRLQMMCYKYLWDNLIAEKFPAENFFSYFDLDPSYLLSDDVKRYISSLGFNAKTFEDVLKYFKITCHTLWWFRSQEQLLLRYELQADDSLLEEYLFTYDARWFKDKIQEVLSFWQRSREPKFVTEEERWKCRICKFAPDCPMISSTSKC